MHEDLRTGGFGAEIAAVVADEAFLDLDAPVARLTMPDIPSPHNPVLLDWAVPSVERIAGEDRRAGGVLEDDRRPRPGGAGGHQGGGAHLAQAVGERVEENEPLVELETDKVAMEVPAPASGVLREIVLDSGCGCGARGGARADRDVDGEAGPEDEPVVPRAGRRPTCRPKSGDPGFAQGR